MKTLNSILPSIFDSSTNFLAILNQKGYIQEHNKTWREKLGYTSEELSIKPFWEYSISNSLEGFFRKQDFKGIKTQAVFLDKNGVNYLLELNFEIIPSSNFVYLLAQEIELSNSTILAKNELNYILQSLTVGVVKVNLKGEIIYANPEASKVLELELDKITHKFYNSRQWNQIDLEGNPFPLEKLPIAIAMSEKRVVKNIQHGIIANQTIKWLSVNASPLYNKQKEMIGVLASFQDITNEVKNQIELRKSYKELENFRYALDESAMIAIMDLKGNFTYINQAFCKTSKYHRTELIGKNYTILDSGYHSQDFFSDMWVTIRQGKPWSAEVQKRAKDGTAFWVETVVTPLFDEQGNLDRYLRINYDITKRKIAEQKLQEREEMMESIHSNMKDGIYRSSSEQGLIYVSPGFVDLFAYESEDELYNIDPNILYQNMDTRNILKQQTQDDTIHTKVSETEAIFKRKDGSQFVGLVTFRVVKVQDDQIIYDGIIKDITERKKVEEENAKLALVAQETDSLVIITDAHGYIEWVNERFSQKINLLDTKVNGKKITEIFSLEDNETEIRYTILDAIEKKIKVQVETSFFAEDKQKIFLQVNIQPVTDDNEKVQNFIVILNDITSLKQKTKELEVLSKDLIKRNEGLEQFNYIISHNVRSQVANIIGLMEIYDKDNTANEFNQTVIRHLEESAEKLDDVIKDLNDILELRHHLNENKQKVYFMDLYVEIIRSIEHQIEKAGTLVEVDFQNAPSIFTVKSYLQSILFNLISNAIKYKSPYRKNIIKITTKDDSKYITLIVEDNGIGINLNQNKDKIFGLYQRLHNNTEGKGMGLFIVKTQVEALEGKIEVESEFNSGTKFIVHLKKS